MTTSRARKDFALERGLYVFRYESAVDPVFPPVVFVRSSDAHISIIRGPGEPDAPLRQPGSNFVVRADRPGTVTIDVVACVPQGSIDADVKFEAIGAGAETDVLEAPHRVTVTQGRGTSLKIKGHLASIGDVGVEGGEWLSGPDSPTRIEALSVKWRDAPEGAELRYGIQRAGEPRGKPIKLVVDGGWTGTKGRGEAIVGLVLDLRYPAEPTHRLVGEVLFLGSRPQAFQGQNVELKGPMGREPLVGLKLDLEAIEHVAQARPDQAPPAVAKPAATMAAQSLSAAPPPAPKTVPDVSAPAAPATDAAKQASTPQRARVRIFRA